MTAAAFLIDPCAMRVLFSSTRGSGHVHPLLPYAHALLRLGHEVLVAAPHSVGPALQAAKLDHAPFDHPGDAQLAPIWARFREVPREQTLAIAVREIFAGLNARAALPGLRETIRTFRPDLVVRESAEYGAAVAAAEAGVPHARVAVHMVGFEEGNMSALAAVAVDVLRREAGLAHDEGAALRAAPIFAAFPASLDVVASDVEVFRSQVPLPPFDDAAGTPTWAAGDASLPLVYVTFGTIVGTTQDAQAVYRAALDAVAALPVRALLTTGPGIDAAALGAVPANVTVAQWVPQAEVFPRATALVCHGGSGTMLGGLAAGVPMVIAPVGADQPYNAQRVDEVGAGVAVMKPDATSLRDALTRVLQDRDMRAAAGRLAREMAALPTVDDAVARMIGDGPAISDRAAARRTST